MSRTYEEGVKDGMIESITEDLEAAASRIAILEEELEAERAKKWSAVSKLKMIELGSASTDLDFQSALHTALFRNT